MIKYNNNKKMLSYMKRKYRNKLLKLKIYPNKLLASINKFKTKMKIISNYKMNHQICKNPKTKS